MACLFFVLYGNREKAANGKSTVNYGQPLQVAVNVWLAAQQVIPTVQIVTLMKYVLKHLQSSFPQNNRYGNYDFPELFCTCSLQAWASHSSFQMYGEILCKKEVSILPQVTKRLGKVSCNKSMKQHEVLGSQTDQRCKSVGDSYLSYLAGCFQFLKYHFLSAKGSYVTAVPADEYVNHQVDDMELAVGRWCEKRNERSGIAIKTISSSCFCFTLVVTVSMKTVMDFWILPAVIVIIFIDPTYK